MKTFQEVLQLVWTTKHCHVIVDYPDGTLRSQVLDQNPNVDWIEITKCEGLQVSISSNIYHRAVYKCGEWELAEE